MKKGFLLAVFCIFLFSHLTSGEEIRRDSYTFKSTNGEDVIMEVAYHPGFPEIVNVAYYLRQDKERGIFTYEFFTEEKARLFIELYYKDSQLLNVRLDTDSYPQQGDETRTKVFTLVSTEGAQLTFTFSWNKDGSIRDVSIKPQV